MNERVKTIYKELVIIRSWLDEGPLVIKAKQRLTNLIKILEDLDSTASREESNSSIANWDTSNPANVDSLKELRKNE